MKAITKADRTAAATMKRVWARQSESTTATVLVATTMMGKRPNGAADPSRSC